MALKRKKIRRASTPIELARCVELSSSYAFPFSSQISLVACPRFSLALILSSSSGNIEPSIHFTSHSCARERVREPMSFRQSPLLPTPVSSLRSIKRGGLNYIEPVIKYWTSDDAADWLPVSIAKPFPSAVIIGGASTMYCCCCCWGGWTK